LIQASLDHATTIAHHKHAAIIKGQPGRPAAAMSVVSSS
jgi:hypothetical protein